MPDWTYTGINAVVSVEDDVSRSAIYIGGIDGDVHAVDDTGTELWTQDNRETGSRIRSLYHNATRERLYYAQDGVVGNFFDDGSLGTSISNYPSSAHRVVHDDGYISDADYIWYTESDTSHNEYGIVLLDVRNDTVVDWQASTGAAHGLGQDSDELYIGNEAGEIHVVDKSSLSVQRSINVFDTSPTTIKEVVVGGGYVFAFASDKVAKIPTDLSSIEYVNTDAFSEIRSADYDATEDEIYVANDRNLYRFDAPSGKATHISDDGDSDSGEAYAAESIGGGAKAIVGWDGTTLDENGISKYDDSVDYTNIYD